MGRSRAEQRPNPVTALGLPGPVRVGPSPAARVAECVEKMDKKKKRGEHAAINTIISHKIN